MDEARRRAGARQGKTPGSRAWEGPTGWKRQGADPPGQVSEAAGSAARKHVRRRDLARSASERVRCRCLSPPVVCGDRSRRRGQCRVGPGSRSKRVSGGPLWQVQASRRYRVVNFRRNGAAFDHDAMPSSPARVRLARRGRSTASIRAVTEERDRSACTGAAGPVCIFPQRRRLRSAPDARARAARASRSMPRVVKFFPGRRASRRSRAGEVVKQFGGSGGTCLKV